MDLTILLCLMVLGMRSSGGSQITVVDLTHDFGDDTLYWPGNPAFDFTILSRENKSAGYWYESNTFSTPEHGGTHVDAPSHFAEGKWRVNQIPVSHLVGPAVVLDVKAKAAQNADYLLSVQDLKDWEEAHGKIPVGSIVLMNSGWASRYPNASLVFNTAAPENPATFHFPGIHPDAANFLITRKVNAAGVDTPSLDYGQSTTFSTHVLLGKQNIIGLENLANLDQLPARGATVIIGIVKLEQGSGGPARILALVGDGANIFDASTGGCRRNAVMDMLLLWGMLLSGWLSSRW